MSLDNLPQSATELVARSQADVQRELPNSDPRAKNHWLFAIINACCNRIFDFYIQQEIAHDETFVATATGDRIIRHASERGLTLQSATQSTGRIIVTGVANSPVSQGSTLAVNGGGTYTTDSNVFLSSLNDQGVDDGTGFALVDITSVDFGQSSNLEAGEQLRFQSPILGVDDTAFVDSDTVSGGTDAEDLEGLRDRNLDIIQNPIALFNASAIRSQARLVAGVTRVFVQKATPARGQVTVFFMRDGDDDPIPSGEEVDAVRDSILELTPAHTLDVDVIVNAPTPRPVDFNFFDLQPNTAAMQLAIRNNLRQYFDEQTDVGRDIDEDVLRSVIINTIDLTGTVLQTFELNSPSNDIVVDSGEIAILGDVEF